MIAVLNIVIAIILLGVGTAFGYVLYPIFVANKLCKPKKERESDAD